MQELPPVYYLILKPSSDVYATIFWDGMVFEDGMKGLGGIELPRKGSVGSSLGNWSYIGTGILSCAVDNGRDTRRK